MKTRNQSIQLFRIFACLGVFFVHFGQRVELTGTVRSFTEFGKNGVQLFFIISGYLAAKGLCKPEGTLEYYKKRFISIMPLYYFVILWFFITENALNVFWSHIPKDSLRLGWLRYIFLLNGFLPEESYIWSNLGGTWTIPVFAFFYLLAPWIMKLINGSKSSLIVLLIVFVTTKVVGRFYSCSIIERIHYFFIGILVYYCSRDGLLRPCAIGFLIIAIVEVILEKSCYPAVFTAMICIALEKDIVLPGKIQKAINAIDSHSYALYLVHGAFFCSIIDRLRAFNINLPNIIVGVIAIIGSLIGTVLIHRFVELPMQKMLKKALLES